jgi:hypothetical protein
MATQETKDTTVQAPTDGNPSGIPDNMKSRILTLELPDAKKGDPSQTEDWAGWRFNLHLLREMEEEYQARRDVGLPGNGWYCFDCMSRFYGPDTSCAHEWVSAGPMEEVD